MSLCKRVSGGDTEEGKSHALGAEEELAVEVGLLNEIVVGARHEAVGRRSKTHHREVLEHLTPNGTTA